jgi:hypothetical protein
VSVGPKRQKSGSAGGVGGGAVADVRHLLGDGWLLRLSQWCLAADDDTPFAPADDRGELAAPYGPLTAALAGVGNASREDRAGFRKAVGVTTLVDGADLFHAFRTDAGLEQWRARRAVRLRL